MSATVSQGDQAEPLAAIARAYGEATDLRADFIFPERFSLTLPLPAAVDNAPALLFARKTQKTGLSVNVLIYRHLCRLKSEDVCVKKHYSAT